MPERHEFYSDDILQRSKEPPDVFWIDLTDNPSPNLASGFYWGFVNRPEFPFGPYQSSVQAMAMARIAMPYRYFLSVITPNRQMQMLGPFQDEEHQINAGILLVEQDHSEVFLITETTLGQMTSFRLEV